jgi:hypothetical protein
LSDDKRVVVYTTKCIKALKIITKTEITFNIYSIMKTIDELKAYESYKVYYMDNKDCFPIRVSINSFDVYRMNSIGQFLKV